MALLVASTDKRPKVLVPELRSSGANYWDDRDSNPDALSGDRFSHHYGFRHASKRKIVLVFCGPDCALTIVSLRTTVGRARPVSTPSFAQRESLARCCHATLAESPPTLSASRKQFPILRLQCKVCCVCRFHHHPNGAVDLTSTVRVRLRPAK